jgi:aspartate/methionine/tyrosine aminotransferase
VLKEQGFEFALPEGSYFVLADFSQLSDLDDVTFAKWMTQEIGVATVPGSSFYSKKEDGRKFTASPSARSKRRSRMRRSDSRGCARSFDPSRRTAHQSRVRPYLELSK